MASAATFETIISAVDGASAQLRKVASEVRDVAKSADLAGHSLQKMDRPGVFSVMSGHVRLLRSHFRELGEGIGEVGHKLRENLGEAAKSIVELLPAVGALGALGSVGGLFELSAHAAEAASQLDAAAQKAGISTEQFAELATAAKMSDVSVESMGNGMTRLNRTIHEAGTGESKKAAALFRHLGINLRDMHGGFRDAGELLPLLAEAFKHTTDETVKSAAAQLLFGKAGKELIPLLNKGKDAIDDYARVSAQLNFVPKGKEKDDLEKYKESWIKLQMAVRGLSDSIGAKLSPVLRPLLDQLTQWIAANREWLATQIQEKVKELVAYLQRIDWSRLVSDIRDIVRGFEEAAAAVGGFKRVIELLIALKVISWTSSIVGGLVTLIARAREAKLALEGVRAAAIAAGEAEAFGPLLGSLARVSKALGPIAAFLAIMWPSKTALPEQDENAPIVEHEDAVTRFRKGTREPHMPESSKLSRVVYETEQAEDAKRRSAAREFTRIYAPLQKSFVGTVLGLPVLESTDDAPNGVLRSGPLFGPQRIEGRPPPGPGVLAPNGVPRVGPIFGPQHVLGGSTPPSFPARSLDRVLLVRPLPDPQQEVGGLLSGQRSLLDSTRQPSLLAPASSSAPTQPRDGKVTVDINVKNLPLGSRVESKSSGIVAAPDVSVGYADPLAFAY